MSPMKMIDPSFTVRSMLAIAAILASFWAERAIAQTSGQALDVGTQAAGAASETMQVGGATQAADASAKCDDLAADPEDPDKPAGIRGVETVSPGAVAPCSKAVDADPQNARLNYQAGRAYAQIGEQTKAFFHFDRASSLGSVRATAAVANAYMIGAGVGKDEGKALEMYKRAASQGDSGAAIEVGKYYSDGPSRNLELAAQWLSTVENAKGYVALGDLYRKGYENASIALKWYRKAAEAGDGEASYRIGEAYLTGKGAPLDLTEALKWFEDGAESNGSAAMAVSAYYREGWVGPKDALLEVQWLRKSMGLGSGDAYMQLGNYYLFGSESAGIRQDFITGISILKEGATNGCNKCARQLGDLYSKRFTFDSVNYDTLEAVKWYSMAAERGVADSFAEVGRTYAWADNPDYKQATEWLRKGVSAGSVLSMRILGNMYREGEGLTRNGNEASKLYQEAARLGDQYAMADLGDMYRNGDGVDKNPKLAMEWYKKAAVAGSAYAMNQVGILYHDGVGVEQDHAEAGRWYEKAAEAGFGWGDNNLAILFSRGQGVRKDMDLAVDLLESAVGDADVCDSFKEQWSNWSGEFVRALQSRLAAKYGYTGSIDGRFGSGSLKAFDAMCKAKSG